MLAKLRRYFISGLIVFLPLALTINLFILTIQFADGILGRYIQPYFSREFGFYFRGLSILIAVFIILIMGVIVTNFGQSFFARLERFLLTLPFFKQVYPAIKEMAVFLFSREKITFQKVVLIEYPRKGAYSIGFLTNDSPAKINAKLNQELCNVFVPSTPSPVTGFLVLVNKSELIFPEITIEEALKMVVSGGVIAPA